MQFPTTVFTLRYFWFGVQVLELQECGVQLKQCQLVRYNQHTETPGKPYDEPKVGVEHLRGNMH